MSLVTYSIEDDPILTPYPKLKALLIKSGQYKSMAALGEDVFLKGTLELNIGNYSNINGVLFDRLLIESDNGTATLYHSDRGLEGEGSGTFFSPDPLKLLNHVIEFNDIWFYCQKCKRLRTNGVPSELPISVNQLPEAVLALHPNVGDCQFYKKPEDNKPPMCCIKCKPDASDLKDAKDNVVIKPSTSALKLNIADDPMLDRHPKVKALFVKSGQYGSFMEFVMDVINKDVVTMDIKDYTNKNGVAFDRLTINKSKKLATLHHSDRNETNGSCTIENVYPMSSIRDLLNYSDNLFKCQKCDKFALGHYDKDLGCEKCKLLP